MMRKPKNGDDRILLFNQLRKAVALQVELWDVRLALSDTLGSLHGAQGENQE